MLLLMIAGLRDIGVRLTEFNLGRQKVQLSWDDFARPRFEFCKPDPSAETRVTARSGAVATLSPTLRIRR